MKVISIMADFGFCPYAWVQDSLTKKRVGSNVADAVCGLSIYIGAAVELDKDFVRLVELFERHDDDPNFDWTAFRDQGVLLAKKLKVEVGDAFHIRYVTPHEDTIRRDWDPILIE